MKLVVVTFPGSNCDEDVLHVLRDVVGVSAVRAWHKEPDLPAETAAVILPGGFSYGDALRSGALARFSPIMGAVRRFAESGGFVLGICNGFQILLEAGLLPGAMLQNASRRFVCRVVPTEVVNADTAFTRSYAKGEVLPLPVAHHEGCYHAPPDLLDRLEAERRVVFRYRHNPNGSARDIAGLINERGNVLGLMPHPERVSEAILGSEAGLGLFRSLCAAAGALA